MAGSSTKKNNPDTLFDVTFPNVVSDHWRAPFRGGVVVRQQRDFKAHGSIEHMLIGNDDVCNGFVDGAKPCSRLF